VGEKIRIQLSEIIRVEREGPTTWYAVRLQAVGLQRLLAALSMSRIAAPFLSKPTSGSCVTRPQCHNVRGRPGPKPLSYLS
jgi:hypothetical protein